MYIDSEGRKWWKGNLHLHTTVSDGQYSPEDAYELYLKNGYDFVAKTDHWKRGPAGKYRELLLLDGCEYDTGSSAAEGIYHILSIGAEGEIGLKRGATAQEMIDEIHAAGGLAGLAHPAWSLNSDAQIAALQGIDFVEIYNSVSGLPRNARPYSGLLCDILASRGHVYRLAATDDTHFYYEADSCRSYIMVQAGECTREAILASLREGRYYASQGPVLDVRSQDGKIVAQTSEVEEIVYFTGKPWVRHRADIGCALTRGEYVPEAGDGFVRVEVKDKNGNYAWSQYIKV